MSKIVGLKLEGSLEEGVAVSLTIGSEGLTPRVELSGTLPSTLTVSESNEKWQYDYWRWSKLFSRITPGKITYEGTLGKLRLDCDTSAISLRSNLNTWLKTKGFSSIREALIGSLKPDDSVRILIRTSNRSLQRLPWHLWDLIEDHPNIEVALSSTDFRSPVSSQMFNSQKQVRILAILGDSTGIDVEADRRVLKNLPDSETIFMVKPTLKEVHDALWDTVWDVLFFAGHSRSEKDAGRIYINNTDSLTIAELSNALRKAVDNGLQLAIFNSCDGLGLAQELQRLGLSQIIVMREPVPDVVAQEFLKYFLLAFSSGQVLYASVREARDRLKRLERKYPCATWLPTIYQNPGKLPPTWQQLRGETITAPTRVNENRQMGRTQPTNSGGQQQNSQHSFGSLNLKTVLILSALVWVAVMGARYVGMLQTWELESFDYLQRLRPLIPQSEEGPDSRILIVGITEEDLHLPEQEGGKGSLSDHALDLLLQRLKRAKARVIGLDIYHDFPTDKNQGRLAKFMSTNNNFFAVCKASDAKLNHPGISPPAIPINRQGLSDIKLDPNDVLRRYLLSITTPLGSPCAPNYALSFQVGFHYLSQEESKNTLPNYNKTKTREMQIGPFVLQRLRPHTGAYQNLNTWGYQSLLNYRTFDGSPLKIAPIVSLKQMLSNGSDSNTNSIKDSDIEGRIVLIGTTTANLQDYLFTPYSDGESSKKIPGVVAQAQMVSQIISAAKDRRPLLWFWPWWGESLVILCFSLGGAVLVWKVRPHLLSGVAIIVFGACLYLTSLELYVANGSWVPLVPSALALVGGSGSVVLLASFNNYRQRN